jgi:hypothetical protein
MDSTQRRRLKKCQILLTTVFDSKAALYEIGAILMFEIDRDPCYIYEN